MTRNFTPPIVMAGVMILLALLARQGLADRGAVEIMLLVLPIMFATQWLRGCNACLAGRTKD